MHKIRFFFCKAMPRRQPHPIPISLAARRSRVCAGCCCSCQQLAATPQRRKCFAGTGTASADLEECGVCAARTRTHARTHARMHTVKKTTVGFKQPRVVALQSTLETGEPQQLVCRAILFVCLSPPLSMPAVRIVCFVQAFTGSGGESISLATLRTGHPHF